MGTLSSDMFLNPLESPGKQRLRWTEELRGRFEEAVNQLGGADSKFLFWNFPERVAYILCHMTLMTKVLMRWRNRKGSVKTFISFTTCNLLHIFLSLILLFIYPLFVLCILLWYSCVYLMVF